MSAQEVAVKFTGDPSNLKAAAAQVKSSVEDVTRRVKEQKIAMREQAAAMQEMRGRVKELVVAYAGFQAIKGTLDAAGRIQDLSERLGESAESLQRLGAAAKPAGADLETIAKSIGKVTEAAVEARDGNEILDQQFKALGIDAGKFVNLQVEDKLIALAAGFSGAQGDGDKLNAAMKLLGKTGGDLLPLLKAGPEALRDAMKSAVVMTDAEIASLDDLGDRVTVASTTWTSVFGKALVAFTKGVDYAVGAVDGLFDTIIERGLKAASVLEDLASGDFKGAASKAASMVKDMATMSDLQENIGGATKNVADTHQAQDDAIEEARKKRKILHGVGTDADGGSGEESGKEKKDKPDPTKTKAELAHEAYLADPANYRDGRLKNPGLARSLERKADLDRARADRRNRFGTGNDNPSAGAGNGAANRRARASGFYGGAKFDPKSPLKVASGPDTVKPGMSANERAHELGFYKDDVKPDMMGDGSKPKPADSKKDGSEKELTAIKSILDKRLPKKTT